MAACSRLAQAVLRTLALGVLLAAVAPAVLATEVVPLTLAETVKEAEAIVVGTVTLAESRWGDDSRRWIVTDYTVLLEDVVHRSQTSETIGMTLVLTYWGGTMGDERQGIADLEVPAIGQRVILMLRKNWSEKGFTPTVGFNDGLYRVGGNGKVTEANGQELIRSGGSIGRRSERGRQPGGEAVDLETFLAWLRSNIGAIKAAPPAPPRGGTPNVPDDRVVPGAGKRPDLTGNRAEGPEKKPEANPQTAIGPSPNNTSDSNSLLRRPAPLTTDGAPRRVLAPTLNYTSNRQARLPIVVNNFPDSFAPWSPEDEYLMSNWNYYADVFRVYATPSNTYGWPDGIFDLAGWPSSEDLASMYGSGWGSNTVGICFYRWDGDGWIVEADIALNPAFAFTLDDEWVYDGTYAQGFRQVMAHELGHMHGLEHNFSYLSLMNYLPSYFRAFGLPYADDAEGIRAEYPGSAATVSDLAIYFYYASGYQSADFSVSSSGVIGETISIGNFNVENVGTTTIAAPTVEWYLTTQRNFSGDYYYLGSTTYPSLPRFTYFDPTTMYEVFTVPQYIPPGAYYISAYIRGDGGPGQTTFPFSNNLAFTWQPIYLTCPALTASPVAASALSSSEVLVSWSPTPCATAYDVYRRAAVSTGFVKITTTASSFIVDNAVSPDTAYLYAIKAVNGGGEISLLGPPDLATTTVLSDVLESGVTVIRARNLMEVRRGVNAVRTLAGLSPAPFTDLTLTPAVTTIKAIHILEPRAALADARWILGFPDISYTDPSLTPQGSIVKTSHVYEIFFGFQ